VRKFRYSRVILLCAIEEIIARTSRAVLAVILLKNVDVTEAGLDRALTGRPEYPFDEPCREDECDDTESHRGNTEETPSVLACDISKRVDVFQPEELHRFRPSNIGRSRLPRWM
jgi:hypothetical protein